MIIAVVPLRAFLRFSLKFSQYIFFIEKKSPHHFYKPPLLCPPIQDRLNDDHIAMHCPIAIVAATHHPFTILALGPIRPNEGHTGLWAAHTQRATNQWSWVRKPKKGSRLARRITEKRTLNPHYLWVKNSFLVDTTEMCISYISIYLLLGEPLNCRWKAVGTRYFFWPSGWQRFS